MNYYSSSSSIIAHQWILVLLLFIFLSSSSSISVKYSDHCNSIVPEATPSFEEIDSLFPRHPKAYYYTGGKPFLNQNYSSSKQITFRRGKAYSTNISGVLKIQVNLVLSDGFNAFYSNYSSDFEEWSSRAQIRRNRFGVLRFILKGFWSESSENGCMVGDGTTYSKNGDLINLHAVFRVNFAKKSSLVTSLISGLLESVDSVHDSSYFEPISILVISESNYDYSLIFKEIENGGFNGIDVPKSLPLSSQYEFCSKLNSYYNLFKLTYSSSCNSSNNCTPLGEKIGDLPKEVTLNLIECLEDTQRVRMLVKFTNNGYVDAYSMSFNPNTTLVGEGIWDSTKNRLNMVACKILNRPGSVGKSRVDDCSIRLTLIFPAIWTIKDSSEKLGKIWSKNPVNNSDYFETISFRNKEDQRDQGHRIKYEYTQIENVKKLCKPEKPYKKKKNEKYPNADSYELTFDMSVMNYEGSFVSGYTMPIFIGDRFYERNTYFAMSPISIVAADGISSDTPEISSISNSTLENPINISYRIIYSQHSHIAQSNGWNSSHNQSYSITESVEISAEGLYDVETGELCMIGCTKIRSNRTLPMDDSLDCEILIKFQFPSSTHHNGRSGYIKGTIVSTRKETDPLYFKPLDLTSTAYTTAVAYENISRMDYEIMLVIISNTVSCVLILFQLFYANKHPETRPFASTTTLVILTLGYMIPLLLNFEALFVHNRDRQNVFLEGGKWIEVNEVLLRVVTMVAFLLQFRVLQLNWSSRLAEKNNTLWVSEIKTSIFVILPLYTLGVFYTWFVNRNNLRSLPGLILDCFLVPQVILNVFENSKVKALSYPYYVGTTFIRLLPHVYDLYRARSDENMGRFESSYIYANHGSDFYSCAWDVVIPCLAIVFAVVIFLQQKLGGRCVLPRRFGQVEDYQEVSVIEL